MAAIFDQDELAFFHDNGYVVLPNAVPRENLAAAIDDIWSHLGMDRHNPADWYRPPLKPDGVVELTQSQAFWDNRQHPRVHAAFAQLWGTEKLWVSLDRASMKPPQNPNVPAWRAESFVHWDLDMDETPIAFGVQGVLCLTDTHENQGGFHCIPGDHLKVIEWSESLPAERSPRVYPFDHSRLRAIPAKAGDLIIFHRALPHGAGINHGDLPRLAQFILMHPAWDHEPLRLERIQRWQNPGTFLNGKPARLSGLGRKLLGLEAW